MDPEAHARRRAHIVAAAATEFAAGGIEGTSTARICRRAGIGSGTLFHYFATKQEIFHAVFADDLPRVTDLCARATAALDPDSGIDLLVDHLVDELTDPLAPGLASAAYLQANRDPAFAQMLATTDATRQAAFHTLLSRVDRTLVLGVPATARWIQGLVDAAHLGADEVPAAETAAQLRRIIDWLLAR